MRDVLLVMAGRRFVSVPIPSAYHLLHPKLVAIVVAVDARGKPNGMTAAWMMPVSMNPPMICVAMAPSRYTYELIRRSGEFTVNILGVEHVKTANYFGTVSGRYEDKFARSGVGFAQSTRVRAPYLIDALGVLECRVVKEFRAGDHILVIGRVENAYVREGAFREDTYDVEAVKPLLHLGGDNYTTVSGEVLKP